MKDERITFGMKVSLALLKKEGELSVDDIKAIPFVNEQEADVIIHQFETSPYFEIVVVVDSSGPFLESKNIIRLRKTEVGCN